MTNLLKRINFKKYLPIILIGLVFIMIPARAMAQWDQIVGVFMTIPAAIVLLALAFILLLSVGFSTLCGALLNLVTSPSFINISYTSPESRGNLLGNKIIEIGLDITKDFVNLALVAILIYIAFAIALRIGDLNAKKMLVRLVVIALLVNFAPVLVGLIVDASNIVMNFFMVDIGESFSDMFNMLLGTSTSISKNLSSIFSLTGQLSLITQAIMFITVNFATGFALVLFAGIFLVRYVVIWTLVILSPLAFVAWILPATKKFWDMWWSNLIQWSIIGIPLAFFLYLGARAMEILPSIMHTEISGVGLEPTTAGIFNQIFPYFVILIFLFLGFFVGLSTSAMGASSVINITKKGSRWTGSKVGVASRRLAGKAMGTKGRESAQRNASAPYIPETIRKGGKLASTAYGTLGAPIAAPLWALRKGWGEAGLKMSETEIKEINQAKENSKGKTPERLLSSIRNATKMGKTSSAAGVLTQVIDDGKLGDLKKQGLEEKEIIRLGRSAARTHPETFKTIRDAFPKQAEKMVEGFPEEFKRKVGLGPLTEQEKEDDVTIPMRIMTKVKPDFIPKVDEESLLDKDIQTALHSMSSAQVSSFLEKGPAKAKDTFISTAKEKGLEHYEKNNPGLANYFKSNPGIRALEGGLPKTKFRTEVNPDFIPKVSGEESLSKKESPPNEND